MIGMDKILNGSHAKWHCMLYKGIWPRRNEWFTLGWGAFAFPLHAMYSCWPHEFCCYITDCCGVKYYCIISIHVCDNKSNIFLGTSPYCSRLAAFEDAVEHAVTELLATLQSCDFSRLTRSVLNAARTCCEGQDFWGFSANGRLFTKTK